MSVFVLTAGLVAENSKRKAAVLGSAVNVVHAQVFWWHHLCPR